MNTDDEKISSLYHEADTPAPAKTLDDAILAASRDAANKPASTKGPFSGRWPAAASIAAVIVITIILVPILKQQESQQALTQTSREISSLPEVPEKTGLNAYRSTELRKKSTDSSSPAGEPALLLEDSDLSEYRAMPARSNLSSGAAKSPAAGAASALDKEEMHVEPGTPDTGHSILQAADSAPFAILTPEMWEVKIFRLIAEGNKDDAKAEIDKLKEHYPEHMIDPALMETLK
jgi:hypothetical protein